MRFIRVFFDGSTLWGLRRRPFLNPWKGVLPALVAVALLLPLASPAHGDPGFPSLAPRLPGSSTTDANELGMPTAEGDSLVHPDSGTLFVKFNGNRVRTVEEECSVADELRFRVVDRFPEIGWIQVAPELQGDEPRQLLERLKADRRVAIAEPVGGAGPVTNDPWFGAQWGLENYNDCDIDAQDAWGIAGQFPARTITVGVVDSGLDTSHEDWSGMSVTGWDFKNDDPIPEDSIGHGTHVSGIVAARTYNGVGIAGIGGITNRLRVMPLKFLGTPFFQDLNGLWSEGSQADAIDAIDYAIAHGVKVLNHSWQCVPTGTYSQATYDAFVRAQNAGILSVCAAGNEGLNNDGATPTYPASFALSSIISVGASDQDDARADFSNYGQARVDLFAPGCQILSTFPPAGTIYDGTSPAPGWPEMSDLTGAKYVSWSGTSMAAPHVSAAAASLLSTPGSGSHTAATVKRRIMETTDPQASLSGLCVTGGRLDLGNLMRNLRMAGSDRYVTAAVTSQGTFASSTYAVIATGEGFPDALSASGLAGSYDCPLLLTKSASLPSATSSELARLGVQHVFVVGGTAVISDAVVDSIKAIVGSSGVTRLAGANRYATAVAVANRVKSHEGDSFVKRAFFVRGDDFPDGLAVGSLAYDQAMPVLLVAPTSLPSETSAAITSLELASGVVVGGTGAVSSDVFAAIDAKLGTLTRIQGVDRYATAVAVANYGVSKGWVSRDFVAVATGLDFPDALGGGVAAGRRGGVLLLTTASPLSSATKSWVSSYGSQIDALQVLGGEAAVSASAMHELDPYLRR